MFEELKDQLTPEERENPAFFKGIFETFTLYDSTFNGQFILLEKGKDRTWYCNEFKIGFYEHDTKTFKNRPFWGINFGRINSFYLEEDGVLWIGAAEGLIRYEKNELKQYESQFYSLIRNVRIPRGDTLFNGAFVDSVGLMQMHQNQSEIPQIVYKHNDIEFFFAAPYFEDEHRPEYRYMLEGSDEIWSDWETKSEAKYNNLHEGEYKFRVEARNVYGQISEQATYTFIILPPWYRTTWAYILYAIAFILILLLGVRISSQRLKKKNIWLEGIVEERTREISQKNTVLEHQQQEIQDSINYAQRIQEAILPLEDEMKKWIPDSFVLFRPKDIVSGDFYWFLERDNKLVFICADCTGHGVPGAFMSMIGSDRLNNIVSENKITAPGAILSELNRAIKKSLKQDGQKNATRDGMDAAVCTIDLTKKEVYYAGANRPLWLVENKELTEIKATKVAVAGFTPEDQTYEEHIIPLRKGLKFYMTSDGYADQFGGERNKKFKVKSMKNLIVEIANEPFEKQKGLLESELLAWMGDFEQVDDVCVIGFEVKEQ
jgi:serine phosphatase RsbU (regulator of sigma subunit)